jgi:hypothetical protein
MWLIAIIVFLLGMAVALFDEILALAADLWDRIFG